MLESLDTLIGITRSGYIPYTSPAPCSTEVRIRENLDKAIAHLRVALSEHKLEFGSR